MIQDPLETIRKFVAGEIPPVTFQDVLFTSKDIENFLAIDPNLGANNYAWPSVHQFLLQQNLDTVSGAYNVQGALVDFLKRNGFEYEQTDAYEKRINLIQNSQPKWLDVPDGWIEAKMISRAGERTGKELQAWLKEEFLRMFQYVKKPPKWLQAPAWPISEDRPLVFLGQIDLDSYFHDRTSVYVFHDSHTGKTENVVQSA